MSELKTSAQWFAERTFDYDILDPDGWDRQNYKYSFNEELITFEKYQQRLALSTIKNIQRVRITDDRIMDTKQYLILAYNQHNDLLTYFVETKNMDDLMDNGDVSKFLKEKTKDTENEIKTFSLISINEFENLDE